VVITISFRAFLAALAFSVAAPVMVIADNPLQAFARSWEAKPVILKQMLYSLVYNERGRLGTTRSNRREGLTVATPAKVVYYQFDGRHGKDDIKAMQPQKIMDAVNAVYEVDSLNVQSFRKVEPLMITRYGVGFELTIARVRVDRDTVHIAFVQAVPEPGDDPSTTLTIKWPAAFSKTFDERHAVEDLMREFIEVKQTS